MSFLKRLVPINAKIYIQIEDLHWSGGLPTKGVAYIDSNEQFHAENVRMELRVKEEYSETVQRHNPKGGGLHSETVNHSETVHSSDEVVSEAFDILVGERKEFPFAVNFPVLWPKHNGGQLHYSLKAVANVLNRPDVTTEITYSPPGEAHKNVWIKLLAEADSFSDAAPQIKYVHSPSYAPPEYSHRYDPESGAGKNYSFGFELAKKHIELGEDELNTVLNGASLGDKAVLRRFDERFIENKVMREGFVDGLKSLRDARLGIVRPPALSDPSKAPVDVRVTSIRDSGLGLERPSSLVHPKSPEKSAPPVQSLRLADGGVRCKYCLKINSKDEQYCVFCGRELD